MPRQPQSLEKPDPGGIAFGTWPVAVLLVRGLYSARSVLRVRNALLSVSGVIWVDVAPDPGLVRVAFDSSLVDPETLPEVVAPRVCARLLLLVRPYAPEVLPSPTSPERPADSPAA